MKINIFILLLFVLVAFLPVRLLKYFSSNENYDFIIVNCNKDGKSIFYKIIHGKINLLDKKLPDNQYIYNDTITLEYNSVPTRIKNNEFYIKSSKVNILYVENSKKYIASYSIEDWKPRKYIPWFYIWSYFEWSLFILLTIFITIKNKKNS